MKYSGWRGSPILKADSLLKYAYSQTIRKTKAFSGVHIDAHKHLQYPMVIIQTGTVFQYSKICN